MYKKIYITSFTIICMLCSFVTMAQDSTANKKVEMATGMRSNGKIYVVVAVLVIILSGLVFYVARLDRKIGKMEKELK